MQASALPISRRPGLLHARRPVDPLPLPGDGDDRWSWVSARLPDSPRNKPPPSPPDVRTLPPSPSVLERVFGNPVRAGIEQAPCIIGRGTAIYPPVWPLARLVTARLADCWRRPGRRRLRAALQITVSWAEIEAPRLRPSRPAGRITVSGSENIDRQRGKGLLRDGGRSEEIGWRRRLGAIGCRLSAAGHATGTD